jgi:hypothetical protein
MARTQKSLFFSPIRNCEQAQVAGFFETVGDGAMLEPPVADEGLAVRLILIDS